MADLTNWQGSKQPEGDPAQRSLDLYWLLTDTYGDSGKIEELVNGGSLPEGKTGVKARELAKGLTVQWAQQVSTALIEDEVVDENLLDSDQSIKAINDWIVEVLGA